LPATLAGCCCDGGCCASAKLPAKIVKAKQNAKNLKLFTASLPGKATV
jgi:hypothetical protein